MNCQPGDLALVVVGPHAGRIGTVLGAFDGGVCGFVQFRNIPRELGLIWVFEVAGHFEHGGRRFKQGPFPDAWLRPLRAGPGRVDEVDTDLNVGAPA